MSIMNENTGKQPVAEGRASSTPAARALLIALIFVAIALNYVDRQVLALLKPTLESQFEWSDRDYALLGTAFQITAALSFLFVGWFVDQFGVRRALGWGVGLWSLAGIAHAFAATVSQFVMARIALAAAETVGTPAAVKAAAVYLPVRQRSFALGIGNMAPNIGAIVTPLLIPPFALAFGWKAAFIVTGALGFVWLIFWVLGTRTLIPVDQATEASAPPTPADQPSNVNWGELLSDRRTWAIIGAKFLSDLGWFFLLFFMPDFFARVFNMKQGTLGGPTALTYSFAAIGALSSGMVFPYFLSKGWSMNRSRKTSMFLYACMILPMPLAIYAPGPWSAAAIIGIALFAHQGFSTNVFGMTADAIPVSRVATVIGAGAVAGNLSGAGMIWFAGFSLSNGLGYWPMFAICASAYLLALLWIHLMLPVIRPAHA